MFPVYLNSEKFNAPNKGSYYLLCKDGVYFRQETVIGSAFVKVASVPHLKDSPSDFDITAPKIDGLVIAKAWDFFREVFNVHRSESYLTLMYHKESGKFDVHCPQQEVSYASVRYDRTNTPRENGWVPVGTIHSHCDFSAFHSGTDTNDEASFDGIHITLGHVNSNRFSMVSSVVFSNNRRQCDPLGLIDNVIVAETHQIEHKGLFTQSWVRQENNYKLNLTDEQEVEFAKWHDEVLPSFMANVEKRASYIYTKNTKSSKYYDSDRYFKNDDLFGYSDDYRRSDRWTYKDSKKNIREEDKEENYDFEDNLNDFESLFDISVGEEPSLNDVVADFCKEFIEEENLENLENKSEDLPN